MNPTRDEVLDLAESVACIADGKRHSGNSSDEACLNCAAVAELIKAASNIQSRIAEGVSPDPEEWDWLDSALARIGSNP